MKPLLIYIAYINRLFTVDELAQQHSTTAEHIRQVIEVGQQRYQDEVRKLAS